MPWHRSQGRFPDDPPENHREGGHDQGGRVNLRRLGAIVNGPGQVVAVDLGRRHRCTHSIRPGRSLEGRLSVGCRNALDHSRVLHEPILSCCLGPLPGSADFLVDGRTDPERLRELSKQHPDVPSVIGDLFGSQGSVGQTCPTGRRTLDGEPGTTGEYIPHREHNAQVETLGSLDGVVQPVVGRTGEDLAQRLERQGRLA